MPPVAVRYEQAVYGSFPFWDKGYAILARSPGCRDEWLADLRATCQRYGERPAGAAEAGGLIALKLPSGPWAVIGPSPQGCDDQGRPGALAFHALFISGHDYRKAGAFPFELAKRLRVDWDIETTSLESGHLVLDESPLLGPSPSHDPNVIRIAEALSRGRRVALEAVTPIDDLARQVYLSLPLRRRARLSLATWTFANGNRHDLTALPRLAGIVLDRTYVDPHFLLATKPEARPARLASILLHRRLIGLGVAIVLLASLGLALRGRDSNGPPKPLSNPTPAAQRTDFPSRNDRQPALTAVSRKRIVEGLFALAERFGAVEVKPAEADFSPAHLMTGLRERLSYHDAYLTSVERDDLSQAGNPDRVLAWDDHIRLFQVDRPLPGDFAQGPLEWQLRVIAWSFHLNTTGRSAEEIPQFVAESLSLPFNVRSTTQVDRYPALADYARFLRRLPAR